MFATVNILTSSTEHYLVEMKMLISSMISGAKQDR